MKSLILCIQVVVVSIHCLYAHQFFLIYITIDFAYTLHCCCHQARH